jgi:hypothetical protein
MVGDGLQGWLYSPITIHIPRIGIGVWCFFLYCVGCNSSECAVGWRVRVLCVLFSFFCFYAYGVGGANT